MYLTVCWMFLCPSHACSALVSWPALARAYVLEHTTALKRACDLNDVVLAVDAEVTA